MTYQEARKRLLDIYHSGMSSNDKREWWISNYNELYALHNKFITHPYARGGRMFPTAWKELREHCNQEEGDDHYIDKRIRTLIHLINDTQLFNTRKIRS